MSQAILQALTAHEPTAFVQATKWMNHCKHGTPEGWVTYSKLMHAYLEQLEHYHHEQDAENNAWPIVRYYTLALERLQKKPWHSNAYLELHNTVEQWPNIPPSVWKALHAQQWDATPLYQWSLDNEDIQQNTLNARPAGKYHAEPLHVRMGAGLLTQYFRELPLLVDSSVHWNLWTVFQGEECYHTSSDLTRKIELLCQATPASFEHAITEFYQRSEHMFNQARCATLLKMDMSLGHQLTTCCGVLLLYMRFRFKGRKVFQSIEKRYPALLEGLDVHLAIYPDVCAALVNAPAIMDHWMRAVHGQAVSTPLELPSNLESAF